ncbi:hypothetical protein CK503_05105 [Aliifodinibius salipaludis]|uniref:DUF2975 domain-containing protein n=1 Tax=Fodinibius salipaludis TaxID=2032627 RepID=A0A2A2GDK0_9BACT|nr:DUF2975 domain-containing protein [Aliifodinibius salipaludis]PAU94852.1 hypothetical protein CK503_05105 [Aliifodinibius salipaludis]
MSGFSKKSTAYICYLIVNVWWYLSCVIGVIFPATLIYEYFYSSHPDSIFGITLPLEPSLVTLNEEANYEFLDIDSVTGTIDFDFIMQSNPIIYIIWSGFICIALGLFLYGLYQLRSLLKRTINGSIFTAANIQRIKTIAILLIIVEPLQWLTRYLIRYSLADKAHLLASQQANINIKIPMVGEDWMFIIIGLIVFTLAAVFEKGNEMYQELKLTV